MSNGNSTRVDMTINRYHTANLSDADARTILANASEALTTDDGANDVACPMDFQLQGTVTTFTTGDGSVDSQAEYNAVRGTGGRVHVVRDITYCGGAAPAAIGCSDTPGSCMVVMRDSDEAVLWAHEYGHNTGLDDTEITGNVMNGTISGTNRSVSQGQCNSYRGVSPGLRAREEKQTPSEREESPMDIKDFVRRKYIHGVPYAKASSYSTEAVPVLLQMLRDPQDEPYRANIVATLGMIGDARAIQPLLDLFAEGSGKLSDQEFKVRKTIVMSLGYLLNKADNREAFEFLLQGLDPESWTKRVGWDSPDGISEENTKSQLTKMAIWGLALSGKPEAREALLSLQQAPLAMFTDANRTLLVNVAQEAIDAHSTVAEKGISGYYQR
ncbi:MAG: HEAT repeat domain-containing protein [Pyrinomonadaceae bacterium]